MQFPLPPDPATTDSGDRYATHLTISAPDRSRGSRTLHVAVAVLIVLAAIVVIHSAAAHSKIWQLGVARNGYFGGIPVAGPAPSLHVAGNKIVSAQGQQVVLRGVNRSGTEYMCVDGYDIFDGPSDQASVAAIKSWHVNAVRIPLNEDCWNGDSYVSAAFGGTNYQQAIETYVRLLNANGLIAILDLHWSDGLYSGSLPGCASAEAICQKPMPDVSVVSFWKSVASAFSGNGAVIFDLFNEPFPDGASSTNDPVSWQCWLDGGSFCGGLGYQAAGMQDLVNAVRSAGATNVLMIGGPAWANDLSRWLAYEPRDPLHNLVASWHSYDFNECDTVTCWNQQVAPVLSRVPVIAGEIGQENCTGTYLNRLMTWMDARLSGYLAFTWDVWPGGCDGYPALISDYSGTPTAYGALYRAHLRNLAYSREP